VIDVLHSYGCLYWLHDQWIGTPEPVTGLRLQRPALAMLESGIHQVESDPLDHERAREYLQGLDHPFPPVLEVLLCTPYILRNTNHQVRAVRASNQSSLSLSALSHIDPFWIGTHTASSSYWARKSQIPSTVSAVAIPDCARHTVAWLDLHFSY
jgi:hypothetical protein